MSNLIDMTINFTPFFFCVCVCVCGWACIGPAIRGQAFCDFYMHLTVAPLSTVGRPRILEEVHSDLLINFWTRLIDSMHILKIEPIRLI